jgi:hypothetical protein
MPRFSGGSALIISLHTDWLMQRKTRLEQRVLVVPEFALFGERHVAIVDDGRRRRRCTIQYTTRHRNRLDKLRVSRIENTAECVARCYQQWQQRSLDLNRTRREAMICSFAHKTRFKSIVTSAATTRQRTTSH